MKRSLRKIDGTGLVPFFYGYTSLGTLVAIFVSIEQWKYRAVEVHPSHLALKELSDVRNADEPWTLE